MKKLAFLLLLTVIPVSAQERTKTLDRKYWLAISALGASKSADMWTTRSVIERGGYERNPFFGRHPSVARLGAMNTGAFAAESYVASRLKGSHNRVLRKLWWVEPVAATGVHVFWTFHNSRVCRGGCR